MPSSPPTDGTPPVIGRPVARHLETVVHRPRPGTVLVTVSGEIDMVTAPCLRRLLLEASRSLASGEGTAPRPPVPRRVVCDLSGVAFLGAAGLGALVAVAAATRAHGTELRIVTGTRIARRVLALAGLDRDLDTAERLADVLTPFPHS